MSCNLHTVGKTRPRRITGIVDCGVFLVVTGLVIAVYLTPLKDWLANGQFVQDRLGLFGFAAPLVFTFSSALLTVIGTPRLLLCSLGGMAFGFAWGLMWTQLGTLLGSYVVFLFIRWRGREYALHLFTRFRGFSQQLEKRGLMSVVLIRQLPINGFYNNVLLGLTPVSHGDFLIGSLLGFLPLGVTACLLGAGLIQKDLFKGVRYIVLGLACSVILGYIFNRLFDKLSATREYD